MKIHATSLPEVLLLEPRVFGDERGFFFESWNRHVFADLGIDVDFVQDNHSLSSRGILRGMHYQTRNVQGKLVRVIAGEVFDVAVDLRGDSPRFGCWTGTHLSAVNRRMLWIPPGFAHGFYVTSESAEFIYKCSDYYDPAHEVSLRWDDPQVGIEWPLPDDAPPILSAKDAAGLSLAQAPRL